MYRQDWSPTGMESLSSETVGPLPVPVKTANERILESIEDYWKQHRTGPSVRQVCRMAGVHSTSTAWNHMKELVRQGKLTEDYVPPKGRCRELLNGGNGQ